VKAELVLSPWVQGEEEKNLGVQHWLATFYYMVYAILQVILIIVQYIRPLLINFMFLVTRPHVILMAASIGHYW